MRWLKRALAAGAAAGCVWCAGGEISTGFLIGPRQDPRSFYYRSNSSLPWQKTYSGGEFRRQAQGKLAGVQLVAGIADDARLAATLGALDDWSRHGIRLLGLSLQGPQEGHNAFAPDGALKAEWEDRLERLLAGADAREMIVNLVLFHENQDQYFDSSEALVAAASNVTDTLIARGRRNVILSVATNWNSRGWDHDAFVPQRLGLLVDTIRDRFQAKHCDYVLPLAISTDVKLAESSKLVKTADVLMVQGDGAEMDGRKFERPEVLLLEAGEAAVPPLAERTAGWLYRAAPGAYPSDVAVAADRIAQWVLVRPPRPPAGTGAK